MVRLTNNVDYPTTARRNAAACKLRILYTTTIHNVGYCSSSESNVSPEPGGHKHYSSTKGGNMSQAVIITHFSRHGAFFSPVFFFTETGLRDR